MYVPKPFEAPDIALMHALIRARPLATLVTLSATGLNANHIPLVLSNSPAPFGTLQGHVARANSLLIDLKQSTDVLAIFHGPDSYISPSWYATKRETGKVVPTWNYAVAHAYGSLRVIDDPLWLRAHLETLTNQNETSFAEPWAVSDAPHEFTEKLLGQILGFEIVLTRLIGKWKVSQNQPPKNQASVIDGLRSLDELNAAEMAALVESNSKTKQ